MTSYLSSSCWTVALRWSSCSQPGAFWVICGDLVADHRHDREHEQRQHAITTTDDHHQHGPERRIPRRMKNSTDGLRPTARNIATTISIRTEEMPSSWVPSQ